MPKDWGTDPERRERAGIPDTKKQESKTVMGLRMIKKLYKRLSADIECVVYQYIDDISNLKMIPQL